MTDDQKLKVINLFGPPGVGKSSARGGLFWLMKSYHLSVEEVSEYAKQLVLEGRSWQLKSEQLYLLAQQSHKQAILVGKYEYAVTDSPLALCHFYAGNDYLPTFEQLVRETIDRYDNVNFYLRRDLTKAPYERVGRIHNLEDAIRLDGEMRLYLQRHGIAFTEVLADEYTPWRILEHIVPNLAAWPTFPDSAPSDDR